MTEFSVNAFFGNFLAGVSRTLFIFYIFLSPFFIEDELRRIDKRFNIAQIFLPLLALVKLFFGLMHIILKSNSKEVTKLLITMIFLSGIVLHSNLSSDITFKDIYLNKMDNTTEQDNAFYFLSFKIPNILDTKHLGVGITANVAQLSLNTTNLISYHWLIIIGIVSSVCCHMITYKDYSKIGRIGLGIFYILYGICIMLLSEFQRPWIHLLTNYNIIDSSTNESSLIRIILIIAFICCSCGASLITTTKYKKIGILLCIGYIGVLLRYEVQCLLIAQNKRQQKETDINTMLEYHEKYIYPTDYQLIRILNLGMVLSGTMFELLKIYHPEAAQSSQNDYTKVDDDVDDDDAVVNDNHSIKKSNKKRKKRETKKQK